MGQLASTIMRAVAFTPLFPATQVEIECAALLFVRVDVLIDAFVAKRRLLLKFESSAALLWTPLLAEELFDLLPGLWLEARLSAKLKACECQFLSLFRPLATPAAPSPHLARHGRLMDVDL
jgi:hypothetical protein